jgi:hypothetical protein
MSDICFFPFGHKKSRQSGGLFGWALVVLLKASVLASPVVLSGQQKSRASLLTAAGGDLREF